MLQFATLMQHAGFAAPVVTRAADLELKALRAEVGTHTGTSASLA